MSLCFRLKVSNLVISLILAFLIGYIAVETKRHINGFISMRIHGYQTKEILRKYGMAKPQGICCLAFEERRNRVSDVIKP
ncbi:hypothetical protein SAMN05216333_11927 [Nitrosomonas oligotropha]|uniref:Uncharacterized protein n=1 Tax=Nitrosomonas oligotropha TaxID=42354 RepID=A0A1H8SK99_9PROT|nr:hypothetical protein SAMN05216300_12027 [Nitrosomonas oligotropha]SEO78995.1 hypothetical protein SAMN05216333_11927 [Nitrosomonas oligotropha]